MELRRAGTATARGGRTERSVSLSRVIEDREYLLEFHTNRGDNRGDPLILWSSFIIVLRMPGEGRSMHGQDDSREEGSKEERSKEERI